MWIRFTSSLRRGRSNVPAALRGVRACCRVVLGVGGMSLRAVLLVPEMPAVLWARVRAQARGGAWDRFFGHFSGREGGFWCAVFLVTRARAAGLARLIHQRRCSTLRGALPVGMLSFAASIVVAGCAPAHVAKVDHAGLLRLAISSEPHSLNP